MTAQAQLDAFIDKYSPEIGYLAREVLARMRVTLPGAIQLIYDNYNALVIGFGPTERPSDAVFSVALYPRWVNLFFLYGAFIPDPNKILKGSGKQVRSIVVGQASDLDTRDIKALIASAIEMADPPFPRSGSGQMIVKSVSAKQRPRRPR